MADLQPVAVVTGAGSGIGRAAALALAEAGYRVALAGRQRAKLDETAAAGPDGAMLAVPTDVTDAGEVAALFESARTRFGRIDLLFNNAGINIPAVPLDEQKPEDLAAIVSINLLGSLLCAREAMRHMKAQTPQGGRIINNGSVSAYAPRPHAAPYTATKHAITGLTKSITLDGRRFNIACGQIDVGNAATDMTTRMTAGVPQAHGGSAVEARLDVRHVAQTIVYMAGLPLDANIPFVTVMASAMPLYGRG